jgi:class 3 adenylate cyclase
MQLDDHNRIVRGQLNRFRGNEMKSLGDGFLATFDGPGRALRCAKAIIQAVSEIGIDIRVGVHTGEVEITQDDVRGIAVHIASRISELGQEGEIIVSRTVKDLVAGSEFGFEDLGLHQLKGISEDWQVYRAFEIEPA